MSTHDDATVVTTATTAAIRLHQQQDASHRTSRSSDALSSKTVRSHKSTGNPPGRRPTNEHTARMSTGDVWNVNSTSSSKKRERGVDGSQSSSSSSSSNSRDGAGAESEAFTAESVCPAQSPRRLPGSDGGGGDDGGNGGGDEVSVARLSTGDARDYDTSSDRGGGPSALPPPTSRAAAMRAPSDGGDPLDGGEQWRQMQAENAAETTVKDIHDWNPQLYGGSEEHVRPPAFQHLSTLQSAGWVRFDDMTAQMKPTQLSDGNARRRIKPSIVPLYGLCLNVHVNNLSLQADRMSQWRTPSNLEDAERARHTAALLGIVGTPYAQGVMSGTHLEKPLEDQNNGNGGGARGGDSGGGGDGGGGSGGGGGGDKGKKEKNLSSVNAYLFRDKTGRAQPMMVPMMEVVKEQASDGSFGATIGVRAHWLMFHAEHSPTEMAGVLMERNLVNRHAGRATTFRGQSASRVAAETVALVDGTLETNAGHQWLNIATGEDMYRTMVGHGGGNKSDHKERLIDPDNLCGMHNAMFSRYGAKLDDGKSDGKHFASFAYALNSRRKEALKTGWNRPNGVAGESLKYENIHPDQLDPDQYWHDDDYVDGGAQGTQRVTSFRPPASVLAAGLFFVMSSPTTLNFFDMPLPMPLRAVIDPGPALIRMYRELHPHARQLADGEVCERINGVVLGVDSRIHRALVEKPQHVVTFDSFAVKFDQRASKIDTARGGVGMSTVGDGENQVVRPRDVIGEICNGTNAIDAAIVNPWKVMRNHKVDAALDGDDDDDGDGMRMQMCMEHYDARKEMFDIHSRRFSDAFESIKDSPSIATGWRKVWRGLERELECDELGGSACLARAFGLAITDSRHTPFAQSLHWLYDLLSSAMRIEGRNVLAMLELVLHAFEAFQKHSLMVMLFGPAETGKTERYRRLKTWFIEGWIVMSGDGSEQEGQNGENGPYNGSMVCFDETLKAMQLGHGRRYEYLKQAITNDSVSIARTCDKRDEQTGNVVKASYLLETPKLEVMCGCTNGGPLQLLPNTEPNDGNRAMASRIVGFQIPPEQTGTKDISTEQVDASLMSSQGREKRKIFRVVTGLTARVLMLIKNQPWMQPNMSNALRLFREWDDEVLVNEHRLPKLSERKANKRKSVLMTLTAWSAVVRVFMYKNTSASFDKVYENAVENGLDTGAPPKFSNDQLWEVVRLMDPSEEEALAAFSLGLEYHEGTSTLGTTCFTVLCKSFGISPEAYLCRTTHSSGKPVMCRTMDDMHTADRARQLADAQQRAHQAQLHAQQQARKQQQQQQQQQQPSPQQQQQQCPQPVLPPQRAPAAAGVSSNTAFHGVGGGIAACGGSGGSGAAVAIAPATMPMLPMPVPMQVDGAPPVATAAATAAAAAAVGVSTAQSAYQERGLGAYVSGTPYNPSRANDMADDFEFDGVFLDGQVSVKDVKAMAGSLERRRRARVQFHKNAVKNQRQAVGVSAIGAINGQYVHLDCSHGPSLEECLKCSRCFFERVRAYDRVVLDDGPPVSRDETLTLESSNVLPGVDELGVFYQRKKLLDLCNRQPVSVNDLLEGKGNPMLATLPGIKFKNLAEHAEDVDNIVFKARYDFSTLKMHVRGTKETDGAMRVWNQYANVTMRQGASHGQQLLEAAGVHTDCFRDVCYLSALPHNARTVPIQPRWDPSRRDAPYTYLTDLKAVVVNNVRATRHNQSVHPITPAMLVGHRHEDAAVKPSEFQRRCDTLLEHNRLPAATVLHSSTTEMRPPVQVYKDTIELSAGAATQHAALVAEAMLRLSTLPGLSNLQPTFCNGKLAPAWAGAAMPKSLQAVRQLGVQAESHLERLAYSPDVVPMALTLRAAERLYDDVAGQRLEAMRLKYTLRLDEGLRADKSWKPTREHMPHMVLIYPGYSEYGRQCLSLEVRHTPLPDYEPAEVSKRLGDTAHVTLGQIACSLGREPKGQSEIDEFYRQREGALSMQGVSGDLFASSTRTKATYLHKLLGGFLYTPNDPFFNLILDSQNGIIERTNEMKHGFTTPPARSYKDMETEDRKRAAEAAASISQLASATSPFPEAGQARHQKRTRNDVSLLDMDFVL